ncbi:MAG: rhodanese-like domain-containing protein [Candidatus Flexifilum sp.]
MRKWFILLAALLLILPVTGIMAQDDPVEAAVAAFAERLPAEGYGVISVDDFNVLLVEGSPVLLDVREVAEYEAGHIEGSFNVPIRTLGQNLALLPDPDKTIVVICKGGARAMVAATTLRLLGYRDVRVLAGGYDAWVGAELPTTTEAFLPDAGTAPAVDADVLAAVDAYLSALPQGFGMITAADLAVALVENPPLLIDVRSDAELANGYLEGAQHIWINEFLARRAEWPADKTAEIVVYCQAGYRGAIAMVLMELLGYENVRNLAGGVNAWVNAGQTLVGAQATPEPEFVLEDALADYLASLPETFNAMRVADVAAELAAENDWVIVDVRPADEYAEGHIAGAINIPLPEVTQSLALLPDKEADIIVVCGGGHRSAMTMTALGLLGYENVRSMLSGMTGWANAGNPVVTEPVTVEPGTAPQFDPALFEVVDQFITGIPQDYWVVRAPDLSVELVENPPILIDVRTDGEWANGHLEGAIHIPLDTFMASLDQLPDDLAAPIVVYDNPTHRSSIALVFMRLLGYENVRVLAGGTGAWTNAGFALVTD